MNNRIKQLKFKDSLSKREAPSQEKLFKFNEDNNSSNLPLQSIDYNILHKRSVEVRKSFKGRSILEY